MAGLVAISLTYLVSAIISLFALRQSRKCIGKDLPEVQNGTRGITLFQDIKMILGEKNLSRQILLATGPMFSVFPYTAMIPVIFADDFKLPPGVAAAVGSCAAAAGAVCSATLLRRCPPLHVDKSSWRSAVGVSFPIMLAACVYLFAKNLIVLSIIFVIIGAVGQRYRTLNRSAVLLATPSRNVVWCLALLPSTECSFPRNVCFWSYCRFIWRFHHANVDGIGKSRTDFVNIPSFCR